MVLSLPTPLAHGHRRWKHGHIQGQSSLVSRLILGEGGGSVWYLLLSHALISPSFLEFSRTYINARLCCVYKICSRTLCVFIWGRVCILTIEFTCFLLKVLAIHVCTHMSLLFPLYVYTMYMQVQLCEAGWVNVYQETAKDCWQIQWPRCKLSRICLVDVVRTLYVE